MADIALRDGNRVTTLMAVDDTTGEPRNVLTDADGNVLIAATIADLDVAGGGTGVTSFTPYAVITGGTTATGALQQVSGLGTSGQVLTSNGAGALPSWQAAASAGANTALSNLASVALNTALLPDAAAADDFGSATLPFKDIFLAGSSLTPGTNNFQLTGASTSGTRVITLPDATDTLVGKATTDTLTNKTYDTAGAGNSFSINGTAITAVTGTGSVVLATSPTLVTPALGVATATSINKVAITAPATSATLTIADGKTLTVSDTMTLAGPTGSGNVVFATSPTLVTPALGAATATSINGLTITSSTGTLTITNGKTLSVSNTLTFTGTDSSSVAFGAGGTVAYTNVTTLSSLVSVGTITTGTWDATTVAVTAGGTGLESATAYAVLCGGTTSTAAFQSIASVGTSGQVLTSNGAGALPTFQDAAAGGTVRRSLNPILVLSNINTTGTAPTNSTVPNGIQCSIATGNTGSQGQINLGDAQNLDFYDKNPEFTISVWPETGWTTGNADMWFGDTGDAGPPPVKTQTTKSCFVIFETTAAAFAAAFVNANGTTNTNSALASIASDATHNWRIIKDGTTNIKCYYDYTLKATHTTNLPSGDVASDDIFNFGAFNDSGDGNTHTATFGFLDIIIDAATG